MRFLCSVWVALALMAAGATAGITPAWANNPFGVMLWPSGAEDMDLLLARAKGLGVAWYRPPAVFVDHWVGTCPTCAVYARARLNIALTVRASGDARHPSKPPAAMQAYSAALESILDQWKPDLLVIEHEEDNPAFYQDPNPAFSGYASQLDMGCALAHKRKLACTNGGLSMASALLLTWHGFFDRNQPDQACDFARRALPDDADTLCTVRAANGLPDDIRKRLAPGKALINLYKMFPLDVVNFHWSSNDARTLTEVADYLARATGKQVGSNEISQHRWDGDSTKVRPLLRAMFAARMPVAIWFSIDTPTTASLFEPDGRLRPSGWEFQRQMSGRK